jgi:hypothetical protein
LRQQRSYGGRADISKVPGVGAPWGRFTLADRRAPACRSKISWIGEVE